MKFDAPFMSMLMNDDGEELAEEFTHHDLPSLEVAILRAFCDIDQIAFQSIKELTMMYDVMIPIGIAFFVLGKPYSLKLAVTPRFLANAVPRRKLCRQFADYYRKHAGEKLSVDVQKWMEEQAEDGAEPS